MQTDLILLNKISTTADRKKILLFSRHDVESFYSTLRIKTREMLDIDFPTVKIFDSFLGISKDNRLAIFLNNMFLLLVAQLSLSSPAFPCFGILA